MGGGARPRARPLQIQTRTGNEVAEAYRYYDSGGVEVAAGKYEKLGFFKKGRIDTLQVAGSDWSKLERTLCAFRRPNCFAQPAPVPDLARPVDDHRPKAGRQTALHSLELQSAGSQTTARRTGPRRPLSAWARRRRLRCLSSRSSRRRIWASTRFCCAPRQTCRLNSARCAWAACRSGESGQAEELGVQVVENAL